MYRQPEGRGVCVCVCGRVFPSVVNERKTNSLQVDVDEMFFFLSFFFVSSVFFLDFGALLCKYASCF